MALRTFTSAGVNNLWSNAANWDAAPADNDTVQCAAGPQTIDYDGDMSNAAVWPNGVQLLVGAGGTYTFSMQAGSYFRQSAATVSDISIYCGTVGVEFPFASKATFNQNGFTVGAAGLPYMQIYCAQPATRYVSLSANEAAGQTVLSVDTDLTGVAGAQWIAGTTLVIVDNTITRDVEPLVLVSTATGPNTITVTGGAGAGGGLVAAKVTGARIYLEDRNVRFINAPAAGAFSTIKPASYVRATVTACNRGTHVGAGHATICTDTTKNWTVGALVGKRAVNITDSSTALITANSANTFTANTGTNWDAGDAYVIWVAAPTATIFNTCTGCTFDGFSTSAAALAVFAVVTSPNFTLSGIMATITTGASGTLIGGTGNPGFVLTSTGQLVAPASSSGYGIGQAQGGTTQDITVNGKIFNAISSGISNVNFVTSVGAEIAMCATGIFDVGGLYLDDVDFIGCTTAIKSCARVMACNCVTSGGTTDLDTVAGEFFNCTMGSATEHANYNLLQPWMFTSSEQHDGAAGAYAGWSKGGVCVSNVVTVPTGFTRSFQHIYESATLWNLRQYKATVQAGAKITVSAWLRKDVGIAVPGDRPTVQIINPMSDPLVSGTHVALATGTMSNNSGVWENLSINWTNPGTLQTDVIIRVLSRQAVGGNFYENTSITFSGGGMSSGGGDFIDCT